MYTCILGNSSLPLPEYKKTPRFGAGTAIDTEGFKHIVDCQKLSAESDSEKYWWFLMATADFAAAPTVEQDGTYTVHQTITCHYHVYAPTTVYASSDRPRCITESSAEAVTESSQSISTSRPSPKESLSNLDLDLDTRTKPKTEGKRQAVLEWLIIKLAALLKKVAH